MALIDTLIEFAVILGLIDLVTVLMVVFLGLMVGIIYFIAGNWRKRG